MAGLGDVNEGSAAEQGDRVGSVLNTARDANGKLLKGADLFDMISDFYRTGEFNASSMIAKYTTEKVFDLTGLSLPKVEKWVEGGIQYSLKNVDTYIESYVDPVLYASGLIKTMPAKAELLASRNPQRYLSKVADTIKSANQVAFGSDTRPNVVAMLDKIDKHGRQVTKTINKGSDAIDVLVEVLGYGHSISIGAVPMDHFGKVTVEMFKMVLGKETSQRRLADIMSGANRRVVDLREVRLAQINLIDASTDEALVIRADLDRKIKMLVEELGARKKHPYDPQALEDMLTVEGLHGLKRRDQELGALIVDMKKARSQADERFAELIDMRVGNTGRTPIPVDDVIEGTLRRTTTSDTGGMADVIDLVEFKKNRWHVDPAAAASHHIDPPAASVATQKSLLGPPENFFDETAEAFSKHHHDRTHDLTGPHELLMAASEDTKFLSQVDELWDETALDNVATQMRRGLEDGTVTSFDTDLYDEYTKLFTYVENLGPQSDEFEALSKYINVPKLKKQSLTSHLGISNDSSKWDAFIQFRKSMDSFEVDPSGVVKIDGQTVALGSDEIAEVIEVRKWLNSKYFSENPSWQTVTAKSADPELLTKNLAAEFSGNPFMQGIGTQNKWDDLLGNMRVASIEPKPTTYKNLEESLSKLYGSGNVSILGDSGINGDLFKVVDADGNTFIVKKVASGHAGGSNSVPYSLKLNDWLAKELGNIESVPSRVISVNDADQPLVLVPFIDNADTWFEASGGVMQRHGPDFRKFDANYIGKNIDDDQLRKFALFDELSMEGDAHIANVMIDRNTGVGSIIDREKSFMLYAGDNVDEGIDGISTVSNDTLMIKSFQKWHAGDDMLYGGNSPPVRLVKLSAQERKAVGFPPPYGKAAKEYHVGPGNTLFVRRQNDLYIPAGRMGVVDGRAAALGTPPRLTRYLDGGELAFVNKAMNEPDLLVREIADQMRLASGELNDASKAKFIKHWGAENFDDAINRASKRVGSNMTKRATDMVDGGAYNITGGTTRMVTKNKVIVETGSSIKLTHRGTGDELSGLVAGIFEDSSGKMKAQIMEGFGEGRKTDELTKLGTTMKVVDLDDYSQTLSYDLLQAADTDAFISVGDSGEGVLKRMKNWPVDRLNKLKDDAAELAKQQDDAWAAFEKAADDNFAALARRVDDGEITQAQAKRLHGGFVEEWKYVPAGHEELLQAADGASDLSVTERTGFLKRIRDRHKALNENRRGRWENMDDEVMAHWAEMVKKIEAGELTESEAYRLNVKFAEEWEYIPPPTTDELLFAPLKKIQDKNRAKHGDFWEELGDRRFRERAMPREKWNELNGLYEDGLIDEAEWDRLMREATDDAVDARSMLDDEFKALEDARRAGDISETEMVDGFEELVNAVLDLPIPVEEQNLLLAQAEKGVKWDIGARDGPMKRFVKKQQRMKNDWQRALNESDDRIALLDTNRKRQLDDMYERKEIDVNDYERILKEETSGAYTQYLRDEDIPYGNRFAGDLRKQIDSGVPEPLPDISTFNSPHVQVPVIDETGILIGYDEKMITSDVRGLSKKFRYQYTDLKGKQHVEWQNTKILDDKAKEVVNSELMKLPPEQRPTKVHFQMDPIRTKDNRIAYGMYNPDTKELYLTWSSALKDDLVEVAPGRGAVGIKAVGDNLSANTIVDDAFDWDKFRGVVQHELGHAAETSLEDTVHQDIVAKVWLDLLAKNPDIKSKAAFEDLAFEALNGKIKRGEESLQALIDARVLEIEDVQNTKLYNATTQLFEEAMETRTSWEELPDWLWYSHGVMEQNNTVAHHEFFADMTKQINLRGGGELGMKRVADELNVDVKYLDQYFDRRIVVPDNWDINSKVYKDWYADELGDVSGDIIRRRGRQDRGLLQEAFEDLGDKRAAHINDVIDNNRAPLVSRVYLDDVYNYDDPYREMRTGKITIDIEPGATRASIDGTIYDYSSGLDIAVGSFTRTIKRETDGTWVVEHVRFFMDEGVTQGTGFGKVFSDHMEDMYIARGVSNITLHAAAVGRYYWASRGFQFEDNTQQMSTLVRTQLDYAAQKIVRTATYISDELDMGKQREAAAEIIQLVTVGDLEVQIPIKRMIDTPTTLARVTQASDLAWEDRPRWTVNYDSAVRSAARDLKRALDDTDIRSFLDEADGADLDAMDAFVEMALVGAVETVQAENMRIDDMFRLIPQELVNDSAVHTNVDVDELVNLVVHGGTKEIITGEALVFHKRITTMWESMLAAADLDDPAELRKFFTDDAEYDIVSRLSERGANVHALSEDVTEQSRRVREALEKIKTKIGDNEFTAIVDGYLKSDMPTEVFAPRVAAQARKIPGGSLADDAMEQAVAVHEAAHYVVLYEPQNEVAAVMQRVAWYAKRKLVGGKGNAGFSGVKDFSASKLQMVGRSDPLDLVGHGERKDASWLGKMMLLSGQNQDMTKDLTKYRPASMPTTRYVTDVVDEVLWEYDDSVEVLAGARAALKFRDAPLSQTVESMSADDWIDLAAADSRARRALSGLDQPERYDRLERILSGDLPMTAQDANDLNYLDELFTKTHMEFAYGDAPDGALSKTADEFMKEDLGRTTVLYESDRTPLEWTELSGKTFHNDMYTPSRVLEDGVLESDTVAVHWLPDEAQYVRFVPTEDGKHIAIFPRGSEFEVVSMHEVIDANGNSRNLVNVRFIKPPEAPPPVNVPNHEWRRVSRVNVSTGQGYDALEDGKYYRLAHEDGTVVYEGIYDASKQIDDRVLVLSDASRAGDIIEDGTVAAVLDKYLDIDGLVLHESVIVGAPPRPVVSGTQFLGYKFTSVKQRAHAAAVLDDLREKLDAGFAKREHFDFKKIVEKEMKRNKVLRQVLEDWDDLGLDYPPLYTQSRHTDALMGKIRAATFGGTYYNTEGIERLGTMTKIEPVIQNFVRSSEAEHLSDLWADLALASTTTKLKAKSVTKKLMAEVTSGRISPQEFDDEFNTIVKRIIADTTNDGIEIDLLENYFVALRTDIDKLINANLSDLSGLQRNEGADQLLKYFNTASDALFNKVDVPAPPTTIPQLFRQGLAGGFTVDTAGRQPWSGVSVSAGKYERRIKLEDMTEKHMWDYLQEHTAIIESRPDYYFGGWASDDGYFYMDVAQKFDTGGPLHANAVIEAAQQGFAIKEKAIFRLDDFREFSLLDAYDNIDEFIIAEFGDIYPGGYRQYVAATKQVDPLRSRIKTVFVSAIDIPEGQHASVNTRFFDKPQRLRITAGAQEYWNSHTGQRIAYTPQRVRENLTKIAEIVADQFNLVEEIRRAPALDALDELSLTAFTKVMKEEGFKFTAPTGTSAAKRRSGMVAARETIMTFKRAGLPIDAAEHTFDLSATTVKTATRKLVRGLDDANGTKAQALWDDVMLTKSGTRRAGYNPPTALAGKNPEELFAAAVELALTNPLEDPMLVEGLLHVLRDDLEHGRLWRELSRFYEVWNKRFFDLSIDTGIPMERMTAASAGMSAGLDADQNLKVTEWMARRIARDAPLTAEELPIVKKFLLEAADDYDGWAEEAGVKAAAARKRVIKHTEAGTLDSKAGSKAVKALERYLAAEIRKHGTADWLRDEIVPSGLAVGRPISEEIDDVGYYVMAAVIKHETDGQYYMAGYSNRQYVSAWRVMDKTLTPDDVLGESKVRSFANNINDPLDIMNNRDKTIDFHGTNQAGMVLKSDEAKMDEPRILGMSVGVRPIVGDILDELFNGVDERTGIPWVQLLDAESVNQIQESLWTPWRYYMNREGELFEIWDTNGGPLPIVKSTLGMRNAKLPMREGGRALTALEREALLRYNEKSGWLKKIKIWKEHLE